MLSWFTDAKITVRCSRPGVESCLGNEKVQFWLENVQPQKVFWIFDERTPVVEGPVEVEYAYPFDTTRPVGIKAYHRVDAFYRSGESYRVVTKQIGTENVDFQPSLSRGSSLDLKTKGTKADAADFKLQNATLEERVNGIFKPVVSGWPGPPATIPGKRPGNASDNPQTRSAWLSLEFKNSSNGQILNLLKPTTETPQLAQQLRPKGATDDR